jgi:CheY-like chemotaxis protein
MTTIFVAEDDDDMRSLISTSLENDGYEVIEACDGTELLDLLADVAALARRRPDVIVSDVMMPGYSGLSVLAALRGLGLPVVLITARRDAAVEEDALRLGASAVIRKPLDINDLRVAIMYAATASRSRFTNPGLGCGPRGSRPP